MRANDLYDLASNRGLIALDTEAPSGIVTKRLISLLRVLNRRYTRDAHLVTLCIGEDVEISQEIKDTFPRLRFIKLSELNEGGEFTQSFIKTHGESTTKTRIVLGAMPPILGAY